MAVQTGTGPAMLGAGVANKPAPVKWYLAHERTVLGILAFVAFFAIWQTGALAGGVKFTFFFSSPALVIQDFGTEFHDPVFWADVRISLIELVIGYTIGCSCGVVVGLLAGWYRRFNLLIDPWLSFFYSLPKIVIIPIVVLWFGLNSKSVISAIFVGTFLTVLINTLHGVHTVERRFLDVATSFRASRGRVFRTVVLPSTVPFIISGLRLAVGQGMIGVFVGEIWASTNAGLGYFIDNHGDVAESTPMILGIVVFTTIALILFGVLKMLENRFQGWRPNARQI